MNKPRQRFRSLFAGASGVGLLACLFLFPILVGCSEETNPVGFDAGTGGDRLVLPETRTVEQPEADASTRPPRTTGTAVSLLVGSDEEATARGYIRFGDLPDTTGIRFVSLHLHAKRGRGDAIDLLVKRVLGDEDAWSAAELTWDRQPPFEEEPLDETPRPVAAGTLGPDEVDKIPPITIPPWLIRFWKEFPDSNAGIVLTVESEEASNGIARIVSTNGVIFDDEGDVLPTPTLVFADSLGTDLYRVNATSDAYVIRDWRTPPTGEDPLVVVSAGTPGRFHLRFDLSALSGDLSIVRARLDLPIPEGEIKEDDPVRLAVYQTTESWEEASPPDTLNTDATAVFIETYTAETDSIDLRMEVGVLVQRWVNGEENHGMTIRFADETAAPQAIRFFTREASRKPRLEIVYLRPIDPRWTK